MKINLTALLLLSGFSLFCYSLKAQDTPEKTTTATLKKAYTKARQEFDAFEKEHGNFIQTKNVKMHYLSWGNPAQPTLIWLHGSLNTGYELMNTADKFVKAGYHVIAVDYYGHGQTPVPDHEVSVYHVADDIKFLMDALKISKAFIGGFSRGGYIAAAFYDVYAKNVSGLVLEDGGSVAWNTYNHQLGQESLAQKAAGFDLDKNNPWDLAYNSQFEAFSAIYRPGVQFDLLAVIQQNKAKKWMLYPGLMQLFNLENSQQFLDLVLRPSKTPLFAASMVMMEPRIIFRNLNVPVLILDPTIKDDPMPFEKENEALRQQHPAFITHIIYPDTDHNIHYAHPEKFSKDVIDFLNSHQ